MHFATLGKQVRKWLPYATGVLLLLGASSTLLAFQRIRIQDFQREDDPRFEAAAHEKTEWAFARLRYDGNRGGGLGGFGGFRSGGSRWYTDAPKADRQFVQGVQRLTRLHTRSIEEV